MYMFNYSKVQVKGYFEEDDLMDWRIADERITNVEYIATETEHHETIWNFQAQVHGIFLGRTTYTVEIVRGSQILMADGSLLITVLRPVPFLFIDIIFTLSIALYILLILINFGCALSCHTVQEVLKRPTGPVIGMCGQFLFMPLISYGLGFLIFPNDPVMRLGLFVTAVAAVGGASTMCTNMLSGNLNLALVITFISTITFFGFMPAWLFSFGEIIFRDAKIVVPYTRIAYFMLGLLVPLGLGLAMQMCGPEFCACMAPFLKCFSTTLLLFIITFAFITNLYIFQHFTWQLVLAGISLPWLGFAMGYVIAILFGQPHIGALAISTEIGIRNTGIAIFLLRCSLEMPEMDLATVVPVSCAIMTPIPIIFIFICQLIRACIVNRRQIEHMDEDLAADAVVEVKK